MPVTSPASAAALGRELRARRVAAGRTVASVAQAAGLSVPYVANLENGRGNPTVGALERLASALDTTLSVCLDGPSAADPDTEVPTSLALFSRGRRFQRETQLIAEATDLDPGLVRECLVTALAGFARVVGPAGRTLGDADWHRLFDAAILTARHPHP